MISHTFVHVVTADFSFSLNNIRAQGSIITIHIYTLSFSYYFNIKNKLSVLTILAYDALHVPNKFS